MTICLRPSVLTVCAVCALTAVASAASAAEVIPLGLPDRIQEPRVLVYLAQVRGVLAEALSEPPEQVPPAVDVPVSAAAQLCRVPEEMLRMAGHAGCLAVGAGAALLDAIRGSTAESLRTVAGAPTGS